MRILMGATMMAGLLVLAGCGKNISNTPPPPDGGPAPVAQAPASQAAPPMGSAGGSAGAGAGVASGAAAQAGGLQWSVPENWVGQAERPMRAATYSVPAETGDPEAGECAVFYFGPNEGGGVQANIDRWIGQMKQPDGTSSATKAKTQKLDGKVPITLVDLTGTYLSSSGPMMQVSAEKPGFRMMGAIVQGPQGAVFFKFTGPEKTVGANAPKFLAMVQGTAVAQ
jgi:hypothetical protein